MKNQTNTILLMPWMLLGVEELGIEIDVFKKMERDLNSASFDTFVLTWSKTEPIPPFITMTPNNRCLFTSLLKCSWWVLRGQYQNILSECDSSCTGKAQLDSFNSFTTIESKTHQDVLTASLCSLNGLALFRSQSARAGKPHWQKLSEDYQGRYFWAFRALIELHEVITLSQIGHCVSALVLLKEYGIAAQIRDKHTLSVYFGALSGIYETLGDFKKALFWNEKDAKLSDEIGNKFWKNATRRRKINIFFEQEQTLQALQNIDAWLKVPDFTPLTEVLLLKTKFRCLCQLGQIEEALVCFESVKRRMSELKISDHAVTLTEELAEVVLLKQAQNRQVDLKEIDNINTELKQLLGKAIAQDDISSEANLRLAQGRWQISQARYNDALVHLEASLTICNRQGFQKTKVLCHMFMALAYWAQNEVKSSRTHLAEAISLATLLSLPSTLYVLKFIKTFVSPKSETVVDDLIELSSQITVTSLMRLQFPVFTELIWSFRDLNPSASQLNKVQKMSFWEGFDFLNQSKGHITLTASGVLRLNTAGKCVQLVCDKTLLSLLESPDLRLNYDAIVSIQTERTCSYHSIQHGPALRMHLTRLRKKILAYGLGLKSNSNSNAVHLIFLETKNDLQMKLFKTKILRTQKHKKSHHRIQENEKNLENAASLILDFIKIRKSASLSDLKTHFKVTRQALFRQLVQLRLQQLIKLTKIGRESYYEANL